MTGNKYKIKTISLVLHYISRQKHMFYQGVMEKTLKHLRSLQNSSSQTGLHLKNLHTHII